MRVRLESEIKDILVTPRTYNFDILAEWIAVPRVLAATLGLDPRIQSLSKGQRQEVVDKAYGLEARISVVISAFVSNLQRFEGGHGVVTTPAPTSVAATEESPIGEETSSGLSVAFVFESLLVLSCVVVLVGRRRAGRGCGGDPHGPVDRHLGKEA